MPCAGIVLTATPPGNVKRFSEDQVAEITRRFQLILWNVYSFFVMYANIDNYHSQDQKLTLLPKLNWTAGLSPSLIS